MNDREKNIIALESALERIDQKQNSIYFLAYDTKDHARAAIKHIYDMALVLKERGYNSKILVEERATYTGVNQWLGNKYDTLPIAGIKDDKVELMVDDMVVVPEQYSNILPQLANVMCSKVMLVQQKEYMFETLAIGSRWSQFGFNECITTTKNTKKYISEYFKEISTYVIPPYIGDNFKPSEKPIMPYVAISCRDRVQHRKVISEFYTKFPHLRWITFRDMVQLTYEEFSDTLKECMASVWIDDDSTFGTFPLESMKCNVPVIGKIPHNEPEWIGENGFWTYDGDKIVDLLGTYVLAWAEGVKLEIDVERKMQETVAPYTKEAHAEITNSIFNTLLSHRIDMIKNTIEKYKTEEQQ